jgi:hypothetical protein
LINTIENPADFNLCTKLFFNLDEQLWKLDNNTGDPKIVKLINKAHGDVQLKLGKYNQVDEFKINIRKTVTDILINVNNDNEIEEDSTLDFLIWEKFPPNCAGFFRIRYINEQQSEEQLLTASTSDNFVLEPPSRTAATISGKSVLCFSQIST